MKSFDSLDLTWSLAGRRTAGFLSRHPRKITAAVTIGLAGFGATAFGVAPIVSDASDLPRRMVTEEVAPESVKAQLDALADHDLQLYRNDVTRASDTADTLLRRLGVTDAAAAAFLRNDLLGRRVLEGRSGKMVRARSDASGSLVELIARYGLEKADGAQTHFTRLRIERIAGKLHAWTEQAPLAAEVRIGSGTVNSTLFAATDDAGMPDAVAVQLTEVFATDLDFHRELRRGATFSVVYETLTADGEPITWSPSAGRILAAELVNAGKTHSAIWFTDGDGRGTYYDLNGQSKKGSFLASPLEFSRVSSGFAMRMHPIFNEWKQHRGVDYSAPSGTPVRSVSEGVVEFAGWQNGYGNVVEILHNGGRSTVYAHLSQISVTKGQRVEQGRYIGAVGATGWATGPHLHFEVKLAGVHQDPLLLAQQAQPLAMNPASRARFAQVTLGFKSQLEVAESVGRSLGYGE